MRSIADSSEMEAILVVDDNEANRLLAQSTLEDEGYRVSLACDGAQALVAFETFKPDCMLLDVRMPGVDGFAVCEKIRRLPGGLDIPVIFLTALRDVDTFERALRAGGDDFLTKPFRPAELLVRVQTALKLRSLRTELSEHYELLKRQRDDGMRIQLQKERLMTFVVHDLKNPVNSMDMHAQLLLGDTALSPDSRESAVQIRTEARQLTRMIMNLLDLSKGDEGKLVPKRSKVSVQALIGEVFGELLAIAQWRSIRLESDVGASVLHVDEDLVRRMLTNLVENAIRHAPRETAVTVQTERTKAGVELRVTDAGSGVPAEMRESVFEPFMQVVGGSVPPSRGGRGLGLTFCKLVAVAHEGNIWVEDAAPGAAFCVRFPL
jgi:two-component system, sensor histidine kinase and response regulator